MIAYKCPDRFPRATDFLLWMCIQQGPELIHLVSESNIASGRRALDGDAQGKTTSLFKSRVVKCPRRTSERVKDAILCYTTTRNDGYKTLYAVQSSPWLQDATKPKIRSVRAKSEIVPNIVRTTPSHIVRGILWPVERPH